MIAARDFKIETRLTGWAVGENMYISPFYYSQKKNKAEVLIK